MEQVDVILSGGIVVTMDSEFTLIHNGALAVRGSEIVAVGPSEQISAEFEAIETVDCTGQYVLPGFINAHTHVPMTLLRGLADDLRLDVWLMGYIMPTEREFVGPEFCRLGAKLACAEQIRSGITAFADMYYYEAEIAAAVSEVGMRAVLGQTILKFPAPDADTYEDSLAYTRSFIEAWRDHELITPAVAPHAPYSSTESMLQECAALAMEYDVPVLIHIAETRQEVEDNLQNFDMRVVDWVESVGLLDAKVLAAHCVHVNTQEMHILNSHDCTVAHCPTSNLKLASGIAPVTAMLENGLTVGIGTDGPASNNDLDMMEEIRFAAVLAKTDANDPTALPARQALLMATRQGAAALFIDDRVGSLEVGKKADIIFMDSEKTHKLPHFRRSDEAVYAEIVYASKSTDVAHVMVNGRWLMRDRELLTLDEESLLKESQSYALEVDKFLAVHEGDVLSKLLAVTQGLERGESFEVQSKAIMQDPDVIDRLLKHEDVQILTQKHYRQYDTYFVFDDPSVGRLRYREDDLMSKSGQVESVRSRLTLTMPTKERTFNSSVMLSHSRFFAPADRPLRFYREYFQPEAELELQKDRYRWHIHYQGVLFYVNIDQVIQPALTNHFVEIKSRTWSAIDAEIKAARIQEMLAILGVETKDIILANYLEMNEAPD